MEENTIVAPQAETPVAGAAPETAQPTIFEQFSTKYGVEAKSEADILTHADAWRSQASEYQAKVAELEGRKLSYNSPATEQLDMYVAKLAEEGVTDPAQVRAKVREFIEESSLDYRKLADENPDQFLLRHYKATGLADNKAQFKLDSVRRSLEAEADRLGLGEDEAALHVRTGMQVAAEEHLDAALGRQKALEFTPRTQASLDQIREEFGKSANEWAGSVKELKIGSETIPVTEGMVEDFWNNWLAKGDGDKSMALLGRPHTPEGFREFAELNMLRRNLPSILSSVREKARSDALAEFEGRVTRPNDGVPDTGGHQGGGDWRELFNKVPPSALMT